MFEDWSEEKLDKYDVFVENYDHANVKARPSILTDDYCYKKKYLTIVFLWDEEKYYILGSKYDPLSIEIGEAGVIDVEDPTDMSRLTRRSSPEKAKARMTTTEEASAFVASLFSIFNERKKKDKMINL